MSDRGFDSIAQAMLKQKQLMDDLENENRELRRQIADLRAGYGIFVEVEGKRFPIKGEVVFAPTAPVSYSIQQDFPAFSTVPSLPQEPISPINENRGNANWSNESTIRENKGNGDRVNAEMAAMLEVSPVEELPLQQQEEQEPEKAPTFLEEIMIDEFATASTSPMAVWGGASKKQEQQQIDEEQKAALRRELMGSFLLE